MPSDYTGNPDNFADTISMPDDTDPPDATDVAGPMKALLDDVAALEHGYEAGTLADLAALKALNTTTIPSGAFRIVTGFGRYRLSKTTGATDTEDQPMTIAPTTGTGRWFAQDAEARLQYEFIATASGTTAWTCPRTLGLVDVELIGGGGGGGGGAGADTSASDTPGGGGGGAGARVTARVQPSPATLHDAIVGVGGAGGAAATDGSDGNATTLGVNGVGPFIAANGGQGGSKGTAALADVGSLADVVVPGGAMGAAGTPLSPGYSNPTHVPVVQHAGDGGQSTNSQALSASDGARAGAKNFGGQANLKSGGAAGARGTAHTHLGGGGGGGGGAGYYGDGGAGGGGGDGSATTTQTNGGAGTAAGANSGAGGGGGGGGGAGASGGSTGGAGGAGGSGQIIIRGVA